MNCRLTITQVGLAILATCCLWGSAVADCRPVVARLAVIQGGVESQRARHSEWHRVADAEALCAGDRLRTLERSRATLQLNDQTYVSLDQRTTIVLSGLQPTMPSWLDLIKGVIYLRSRTPSSLDIKTPFINAAIKGTEFLVASSDTEGQVTTFEGRVEASNTLGTVLLSDGQTAVARAGQTPVRKLLIAPEDAVQWALYYPPLIDLNSLRRASTDPAVKRAAERYLAGDSLGALRELERGEQAHALLRAALLLGLGRVDEAQPLIGLIPKTEIGQALALRSVIALARNDKAQALQLAEQSTQTQPRSPVPWTALSYARQAQFELEAALDAAQKADELAPDNGLTQTRLAELLDSLGRRDEARAAAQRAVRLNPGLGRAWTVQGFAALAAMDTGQAKASFENAIRIDSSDPLPHFGDGLARIREGDLEEGTAEIEIAASLTPNDSLLRSYLGKAYYEQKRGKVAQTEYAQAKRFDPRDPTPWFYDAIKKQTENRPVEALKSMQKAIELNDNRVVYRSRQLLDSDLAARSAAIARIYNDLGFGPRALAEGWKSVNDDPSDFSAHRLLADSYAVVPGQEVARASELLQSQLLQPINSTPVQPHLAEPRLLVPQFSGPAQMSFNEFNPAFSRNGPNFQVTGLVGSQGTYGDEAVHSGIWDKFSYSLGQFHYQTQGFRPNNDLAQDIYNAFIQAAVTPDLSLQAEYRHRDLEHGDLQFNGDLSVVDMSFRRNLRTDTERAGLRYSLSPGSDVIMSLVHFDSLASYAVFGDTYATSERGFLGEAQHYFRRGSFDAIWGGGQQSIAASLSDFSDPRPSLHYDMDITNAYLYSHLRYPDTFTWVLGMSVDASTNQRYGGRDQINPKFGFLWNVTPKTLLRYGAFRSFTRGIEVAATIEPTQIAGFNQFYDGYPGTDAWRYGIGVDHEVSPDLLVGAEVSRRDLKRPNPQGLEVVDSILTTEQQENLARGYADWLIGDSFTAHIEFSYEDFQSNDRTMYRNCIVPVGINYFHPSGFSASTNFSYVTQETFETSHSPSFGIVDLALRYRLPRRHGVASLMVKNLLDHDFDFLGRNYTFFRTPRQEESPLFIPDRTIAFQLTLAF